MSFDKLINRRLQFKMEPSSQNNNNNKQSTNSSPSSPHFQIQIKIKGGFGSFLTKDRETYVWGYNNYGQLGLGDQNHRISPTKLDLKNNEKVNLFACGYIHS